jgi:hypothetical protein
MKHLAKKFYLILFCWSYPTFIVIVVPSLVANLYLRRQLNKNTPVWKNKDTAQPLFIRIPSVVLGSSKSCATHTFLSYAASDNNVQSGVKLHWRSSFSNPSCLLL